MEIEKYFDNLSNSIDDTIALFLNENGYKVEKPFVLKELIKIEKQLEEKGLFIDYVIERKTIVNSNGMMEKTFIVPFFNSITKPKTETEKEEIINNYIKFLKE